MVMLTDNSSYNITNQIQTHDTFPYSQNQYYSRNALKLEGKGKSSFPLPNISYSKPWASNEHFDRFLKCMSPAIAVVCTGGIFWGAGFVVNEISKAASFLKNVSLPESFTNLIATSNFWLVVGIVAAVGFVAFTISSAFLSIKKYIKEKGHNTAQMDLNVQQEQYLPYYTQFQDPALPYCAEEDRNIRNGNIHLNKDNYNQPIPQTLFDDKYDMNERLYNNDITINKNNKNAQELMYQTQEHFNNQCRNTSCNNKYNQNNFYSEMITQPNNS